MRNAALALFYFLWRLLLLTVIGIPLAVYCWAVLAWSHLLWFFLTPQAGVRQAIYGVYSVDLRLFWYYLIDKKL